MQLVRSAPPSAGPLGLVALLNVVLLLLFYFLLGSSFVLQPGIAVTRLPLSSYSLPPQVNARLVTLQPGPPLQIYYQDERVTLEELGRRLAAYRGSPRTVIVRADGGTPYQSIVEVMDEAMRREYTVALATVPRRDAP